MTEVGKDENNIGNKLLKKMGWSEGSGLGAEGDGRAEPMYADTSSFEKNLITHQLLPAKPPYTPAVRV